MVLNVDSAVWQRTVKTVANFAAVVLIDVSVLTENLLWEIAEVAEDPSTACVLVGHAEGLRALDVIDTPLEQQLVELLDGRTILAYETSEQGTTRFANALRATLEIAVSRRRWANPGLAPLTGVAPRPRCPLQHRVRQFLPAWAMQIGRGA
jgi:hypothetical protein